MRGSAQQTTETLATVQYRGTSERMWSLPSSLPGPAEPLASTSLPQRVFRLGMGMGMMMGGMTFTINGREFEANRIDSAPRLGTVEEWIYVNDTPMDHPMHLPRRARAPGRGRRRRLSGATAAYSDSTDREWRSMRSRRSQRSKGLSSQALADRRPPIRHRSRRRPCARRWAPRGAELRRRDLPSPDHDLRTQGRLPRRHEPRDWGGNRRRAPRACRVRPLRAADPPRASAAARSGV